MTETITAIYENGVLRPLDPLHLKESQRVLVRVIPEPDEEWKETIVRMLTEEGLLDPYISLDDTDPVSVEQRLALANQLGAVPGKPLSKIVLEDRGEWGLASSTPMNIRHLRCT